MSLFDNIEKKTNIKKEDIFKVADSVKDANFQDEKTVRQLIKQVSALAGKPVSKEKEDKIVKAIVSNNLPMDMNTIGKMFKK
ncbi:stage VI sporulation protein F [Bacillus suaedaesalsae]|uniref:Stage VI sporulation protein F n=1 Tax=Bacillus suaedaesalsae TaxID=2810349 RepID=A0ABS2DNW6_9BACI|nr:stage VI sporulation protein F [Bacillus suaedaesalsae]MBM6619875.1 stage VI sporulation protein F [Bacillus suaedaesalsae]